MIRGPPHSPRVSCISMPFTTLSATLNPDKRTWPTTDSSTPWIPFPNVVKSLSVASPGCCAAQLSFWEKERPAKQSVRENITSDCSWSYMWNVSLPDSESKLIACMCSVVTELSKRRLIGTDTSGIGRSWWEIIQVIPGMIIIYYYRSLLRRGDHNTRLKCPQWAHLGLGHLAVINRVSGLPIQWPLYPGSTLADQ